MTLMIRTRNLLHGPRKLNFLASRAFTSLSSSDQLVSLSVDSNRGVATITMQNPPVNSLSLEMCEALSRAIQCAESDSNIQSLILQSSNRSVFSAGLDLMELHNANPTRLVTFWNAFQQLYLDLYGSRLACVAAVEGHAPAAGCMLALSCDYRIMTTSPPTVSIGLNESQLGIVAPPWLAQQFVDTTNRRTAEMALQLGLLYTPPDAYQIGLVHEILPPEQVRDRALAVAEQWGRIPPAARVAAKMLFRKERMQRLVTNRQADIDHFVNFVTQAHVQANLSAYLEMLAKKKKK